MPSLFTVDLTINMPDGGRHARQLLNLYCPDIPADINQIAYHLCNASEAVLARKFGKLDVKRTDVWSNPEHSLKIFILLSVSGEDPAFIKQVLAGYMDAFPNYLRTAADKYYAHTAFPPEIPLQPTDWTAEVH